MISFFIFCTFNFCLTLTRVDISNEGFCTITHAYVEPQLERDEIFVDAWNLNNETWEYLHLNELPPKDISFLFNFFLTTFYLF